MFILWTEVNLVIVPFITHIIDFIGDSSVKEVAPVHSSFETMTGLGLERAETSFVISSLLTRDPSACYPKKSLISASLQLRSS